MARSSTIPAIGRQVLLAEATLDLRRSCGGTTIWAHLADPHGPLALELAVTPATIAHVLVDQLA